MDVEYLIGNLYRVDRVLNTLKGMIKYLIKNDSKIKWMPKWLALDFKDNMDELKWKLDKIVSNRMIDPEYKKDFRKYIKYLEKRSKEIDNIVYSK